MILLASFVLLVVASAVGFAIGRSGAPRAPDPATTTAVRRRDAFIEHLREVAWRDRDIAPELSTVLLDDIRRFTADPDGWDPRSLG
ncbi:hypothetical protein ABKW28_01850 [Nocardioides sp. 31GB23]|uniref:Uncharacterized protein n=1 Tax=Nocardioides salarius TaxID=374513 RepID=A0ABS2M5A0_9ACTN|nr:hypothetical protein [Nocardioides salarius]MBM7506353.1 hypothetical protein [Nocardioides salarius]